MSTHNIFFHGEIRKIFCRDSFLSDVMALVWNNGRNNILKVVYDNKSYTFLVFVSEP